jgi:hypothetical protein
MSDAQRPPLRRRMPLTVAIPLIGVVGGLAGGTALALALIVFAAIESGGADWAFAALPIGIWLGAIVGAATGVVSSLLRILIGVRFGLVGELVTVSVGAIATPVAFVVVQRLWGWPTIVALVIGVLAALQFCRTVLKRAGANAPSIPRY